ncbi:MAG: DUF177 domain-containing protein [Chloroflexi bacterium]|nr:DUF177 domain-containing protein [Chloroflexota bacterium]
MKFNVAQLLKAQVGTARQYDIDEEIDRIDDLTPVSHLTGKVKLTRIPAGVLVEADLHLTLALACSRCLEELTYPLHLNFSEEFEPTIDVVTGTELPEPEDANTFTIDANHILDLTEAVREYVLLALPMQPLCSEACAGLCPKCGQNLNRGKCDCPTSPADSRLSVLAQLLEDQETDKE